MLNGDAAKEFVVCPSGAASILVTSNDRSRKGLCHEREATDSADDTLRDGRGHLADLH
jgi:hypothetical protein